MKSQNSFRNAKINQKLQKELRINQPTDQDNFVYFIFQNLKELGYGNLPFSKRYALVKGLIQQQYESRSKWKTRVFLLFVYCISLLAGMAGTLQAITTTGVRLLTHYSKNSQQRLEQKKINRQLQIELTTAALRANPNDVNVYIKRAQARLGLHDYKGALADYDQIIRLKPQDIQIRFIRARLRSQLKDYKGAIADANYVIQLNPKQPQAYMLRSEIRRHLGDNQGAIADTQTASNLFKEAMDEEDPS